MYRLHLEELLPSITRHGSKDCVQEAAPTQFISWVDTWVKELQAWLHMWYLEGRTAAMESIYRKRHKNLILTRNSMPWHGWQTLFAASGQVFGWGGRASMERCDLNCLSSVRRDFLEGNFIVLPL
jgi:hypothetical protein